MINTGQGCTVPTTINPTDWNAMRKRSKVVAAVVTLVASIAGSLMQAQPGVAAPTYTVTSACDQNPFGFDPYTGAPLHNLNTYVNVCVYIRSDNYVWGTEQLVDQVGTDIGFSFTGSIQVWVQDCSTGQNTNSNTTYKISQELASYSHGEASFGSHGSAIGNGAASHSFRVIARFIHGGVYQATQIDFYTDSARGSSFADTASSCNTA